MILKKKKKKLKKREKRKYQNELLRIYLVRVFKYNFFVLPFIKWWVPHLNLLFD